MNVQTKFISADTQEALESKINDFLRETKGKLIEIRPVAYTTDSGYYKFDDEEEPLEGWSYKTNFAVIVSYRPGKEHIKKKTDIKSLRIKVKNLKNKIRNKEKQHKEEN